MKKYTIVKTILIIFLLAANTITSLVATNAKTDLKTGLENESTDIVFGTVSSIDSFWVNGTASEMLYSKATIKIDSITKASNSWNKTVQVGFWGGKIHDKVMEFIGEPYGETYCEVGDKVKIYAITKIPNKVKNQVKNINLNAIRINRVNKETKINSRSTPTQQEINENQSIGFEYDVRYWDTSDFPIHYKINANTTDCTGEYGQVSSAFSTWEGDSLSDVDYTLDGTCSIGQFSTSDDNAVFWQTETWFDDTFVKDYVAFCKIYRSTSGRIYDFDIAFNDKYDWTTDGSPSNNEYDVQTIALHEAGHILFLGDIEHTHSTFVMSVPALDGATRRLLQQGDRWGVRHIYPDSSYPVPTVSITSPNDGSHVSSPVGIYATASVSGTTISNVKYRVTEVLDGSSNGYDTGWVSMSLVGGTWRGTWSFTDQNIEYYITVKAETAQGQMGYDWIEVYD